MADENDKVPTEQELLDNILREARDNINIAPEFSASRAEPEMEKLAQVIAPAQEEINYSAKELIDTARDYIQNVQTLGYDEIHAQYDAIDGKFIQGEIASDTLSLEDQKSEMKQALNKVLDDNIEIFRNDSQLMENHDSIISSFDKFIEQVDLDIKTVESVQEQGVPSDIEFYKDSLIQKLDNDMLYVLESGNIELYNKYLEVYDSFQALENSDPPLTAEEQNKQISKELWSLYKSNPMDFIENPELRTNHKDIQAI